MSRCILPAARSLAVLAILVAGAGLAAAQGGFQVAGLGTLPGWADSAATAVNNSGQVVGYAYTGQPFAGARAFLYSGGTRTDLGTLAGAGQGSSFAYGINDSGVVTGTSDSPAGQRAFVWADGTMTNLGVPSGGTTFFDSRAEAINNSGQVVGTASDSAGRLHGFVHQSGTFTDLTAELGLTESWATGINNSGQVVGWYSGGSVTRHAFSYTGGTLTDLGTLPGRTQSDASDVNSAGHVVGTSNGPNFLADARAFLHRDGVMTSLGVLPGMTFSSATAINDAGWVVGRSGTSAADQRAFLYRDGVMTDLNDFLPAGSGWTLAYASDVNDYGQIVGMGIFQGHEQAFLLTPVPEPPFLLAAAAGLAGLCTLRRRRPSSP
jgi:MYXO-CTERM domain-containing protein